MSVNLMDLVASLKLNTQEFLSGLASAKSGLEDFKGDAASAASGGEAFGGQLLSLGSALQDLGRNAAIGGAALTASLTLPIAGVVTEALRMSSTFEQAGIALTTMMRSGVDAKAFLEELKNFAASTPFQFNDILQASQRLQALGFEATAVIPIMTAVGNAVAGLGGGEEKINRITLALGQMQAKGKVSAEEMNQLAEAGIGAWQAVADQLGITVPQAMDRAKRGMLSATEAIPAILEGMMRQTGGLMEAQMTTLAGQWSNFRDRLDFLFADLGRALTPFANAVMQLAEPLLSMLQSAVNWFGQLSPAVQTGIVAIAGLAAAAGPLLIAFGGVVTVLGGVASALGVAGIAGLLPLLTPIIGGVAAAIVAMVAAWELLKLEPVQNAVQSLGQAMNAFWNDTLKPLVESIVAAGFAFTGFAAGVIGSGLEAAWVALKAVGAGLWEGIVALSQALSPLGEAFMAVFDALSPLLSPIAELVVTIAELVAGIVGAGLITAWEALKLVWSAVLPSVRDLATLLGGALLAAIRGISEVANFLASIFRDHLKPALEVVAEKVRTFIQAFAALPGVKQIIEGVSNAINTMKVAVGGAIDGARASINLFGSDTRSSMENAKIALKSAQDKFAEVEHAFQQGKATRDQLKQATDNLSAAHRNFNAQLEQNRTQIKATQDAVTAARAEWNSAKQSLDAIAASYREGKASGDEYVAAQTRLKNATDVLNAATAEQKRVARETGVEMNTYNAGIGAVKESLERKKSATVGATDATKALKEAVVAAKNELAVAYRAYVEGTGTIEAVTEAQNKLNVALNNQHPEQAAEKFLAAKQKEAEAVQKSLDWYDKVYLPAYKKAIDAEQKAAEDRAEFFSRKYGEQTRAAELAASKQVKISKDMWEQLRAGMPQEGETEIDFKVRIDGIKEAVNDVRELKEAYRSLGIATRADLETTVTATEQAYEKIKADTNSTMRARLEAERAYMRANIELWKAQGQPISDAYREHLAEIERLLQGSVSKQKQIWTGFLGEIKGILKGFQNDVVHGVWDQIFGNNQNDQLDKQAADLQKSLGERTVEWEQYQRDVEAAIAAITAEHAANLEQELADLQSQMQEKRAEWEAYKSEALSKLDAFKAAQDENLAEEISNLQANLGEREQAWIQYQVAAAQGLAEFTRKQNEALEEQKAELIANLTERAEEWATYQQDAAAGLAEFKAKQDEQLRETTAKLKEELAERAAANQEYAASQMAHLAEFRAAQDADLQEELAGLARSLESKRSEYFGYVEEVNEKLSTLREASAEKLAEEITNLKKSFEEKKKAYEAYVVDVNKKLLRIGQDLEEQIDDQTVDTKRGIADRQTAFAREERDINERIARELARGSAANHQQIADWRRSLEDKRADLQTYIDRANQDLAEFTDDHRREAQRQTDDLNAELKARIAAQQQAQRDMESGITTATDNAARQLAQQTSDLQGSLAQRTADWQEYQAEIGRKITEAQAGHDTAIANEETKVRNSLIARQAEWDKYQVEIAKKIADAQKTHDDSIAGQEKKVADSLAAKQLEWDKYQVEIAKKIEGLKTKHDEAIDAETLKVQNGLASKQLEWEKYQVEIAKKIEAAQKKHDDSIEAETRKVESELGKRQAEWDTYAAGIAAKMLKVHQDEEASLNKDLNDLKKNLADKKKEYDQYVLDVNTKMQEIHDSHVTLWGQIGSAAVRAIQGIAEALTNLGLDLIIDELKETGIGKVLKDAFSSVSTFFVNTFKGAVDIIKGAFKALGEFLMDIFGDVANLVKRALGYGTDAAGSVVGAVGSGGGAAASVGTSVASAGASGVASIVGAVAGVANAVIGVIGLVQGMGQSKSLGQIEENTRFTQIALIGPNGLLDRANTFWPNLKHIHEFNYFTLAPALADLIDEVRDKLTNVFNEVKALGDIKSAAVDMLLSMVQYFPELTTIRERAHDIATAIGQLLTEVQKTATNTAAMSTHLSSTIAPKLDTISANVLNQNIAGNVSVAFQSALQNAIQPLTASLQSLAVNVLSVDDNLATNATMTTGFNHVSWALSSYLGAGSSLSQGLNNLSMAMYNLPNSISSTMSAALAFRQPVTPVNVVVNVPAATSVAQQIRTQGVTF